MRLNIVCAVILFGLTAMAGTDPYGVLLNASSEGLDPCLAERERALLEDATKMSAIYRKSIDTMTQNGQRMPGCGHLIASLNNIKASGQMIGQMLGLIDQKTQQVCTDQALVVQKDFTRFFSENCDSLNDRWGIMHYGTDGLIGLLTEDNTSTGEVLARAAYLGDLIPHQRSIVFNESFEKMYVVDSWSCQFREMTSTERDLVLAYAEKKAKERAQNRSVITAGDELRKKLTCGTTAERPASLSRLRNCREKQAGSGFNGGRFDPTTESAPNTTDGTTSHPNKGVY